MPVLVGNGRWLCLLLCGAALTGCAKAKKKAPQLDLVPVTGTVTLDGQPLTEAVVSFAYQGVPPEGFIGSGGSTDAQGHYELHAMEQKGAVPGNYKVSVSKQVNANGVTINPAEGMDMEQLRASGGLKETIPAKYSDATATELSATVEKGKSDGYNFDLKSS